MKDRDQNFSVFKGIRDDEDPKQVSPDYFTNLMNFDWADTGLKGVSKIKVPNKYIGLNTITTTLTSTVDDTVTTIPATGLSSNVDIGMITIGSEQIQYTYKSTTNYVGCTRGVNGTTKASHAAGVTIYEGYCVADGNTGTTSAPATAIYNYCSGLGSIDGIKEYRFIDSNNVNHTYYAIVSEGFLFLFDTNGAAVNAFKDSYHAHKFNCIPLRITKGKISLEVYQDDLYIANGIDYTVVFHGSLFNLISTTTDEMNYLYLTSQMGAPTSYKRISGSLLATTYYYKMSYVTAGGEEIIGSQHITSSYNTSGSTGYRLYLPLGYSGTTQRKLYRTKQGGTTFYLVDTIADNTTTLYDDTKADGDLGAAMSTTITNELPKPYFVLAANQKLYCAVNDKFPTQLYVTDTQYEVIDSANYIDITGYGNDETPIMGIGIDFSQVMVGTQNNIYFITPNLDGTHTVTPTRANVGVKDGYSIQTVPANGDFSGGMMYVSTLNDVRIMSGMQALPVATSLDNVRTENWGQPIRGSLYKYLDSYSEICSVFWNYKYFLTIDDITYVFDIRTQGWTMHQIKTATYQSTPVCYGILGNKLHNGQDDGVVEQEYYGEKYKTEDVTASLTTPYLDVSRLYKWANKVYMWFIADSTSTMNISATLDGDIYNNIEESFTVNGGAFNSTYFNSLYFAIASEMDYKVLNLVRPCRWLRFTLSITAGRASLQEWGVIGQMLLSQEG